MKKMFSLVLALVMALSLTTVAWGIAYPSCTSCTDPAHVAAVGTTHYDDLQEAITAAASDASKTVTLLQDVTLSTYPSRNYWLAIEAPITFDGNGKTLTYNASTYNFRVFNIDTTGNVEIKNLTVSTTGERAFNVINQAVNLTLTNVNATAANYAVMVATSAADAKVTIDGIDGNNNYMTGKNVINVAAPGAEVSVEYYTLTTNDTSDTESYAALILTQDATGATITASSVDFDVNGDSSEAYNGANGGEITIVGSTGVVPVAAAAIEYDNGYAYLFETIQDAIDHAVHVDGATESNPVEIIVMDAAINSGESYTPAAGVTVTPPAGASIINNTIVSDSSIGANILSGNYFVKGTGAGAVASVAVVSVTDAKAPKDTNKDGLLDQVGNVKYFNIAGDDTMYVQVSSVGDADMIVYYGNAESVFAYLKAVVSPDYLGNGVAFYDFGEKCGQYDDEPVAGTKYYLFQGVVYKTVTTSATNLMVGNTLTPVEAMADEFVDHVPAYTYDKDYKVVGVKCAECGTPAALYANYAAVPKTARSVAVAIGDGQYYVWPAATVVAPSTDKTVTSAQTFDAGIAMYVGMSVMAAAGSAVVIGKKKD